MATRTTQSVVEVLQPAAAAAPTVELRNSQLAIEVLKSDTEARVTQVVIEGLRAGGAEARTTQVVVEAAIPGAPKGRVTQTTVEAAQANTTIAKVTQSTAEVGTTDPVGRVTQLPLEVAIADGQMVGQLTQLPLEVAIAKGQMAGQVTQLALEVLVTPITPTPVVCPESAAQGCVNRLFRMDLERPVSGGADPPWNSAATPPAGTGSFAHVLGGEVTAVSGNFISVSDTLTSGSHNNLAMVVLSGTAKYTVYNVASNGTGSITTVDTAPSVSVGDWVGLGREIEMAGIDGNVNRSWNQRKAVFNAQVVETTSIDRMDLLWWQRGIRYINETEPVMESMGWFLVEAPNENIGQDTSVVAPDLLYVGDIDVLEHGYNTDRINEWERVNTLSTGTVLMDQVALATNNYYSFYNGLESGSTALETATGVGLNHTFNWAEDPVPQLWISSDNNDYYTEGTDYQVDLSRDPVVVLYGSGEVRIEKEFFDSKGTYLKTRLARFVSYVDTFIGSVSGTVTSSGTSYTISDGYRGEPYPTAGNGLQPLTVKFTTGNMRGTNYTVTSNTTDSITVTDAVNDLSSQLAVGDRFEIGYANYPHLVLEDVYRRAGFQLWQPGVPFYLQELDEILIPKKIAATSGAVVNNGAGNIDHTDNWRQLTGSTTQAFANSGVLYVGSDTKFRHINFNHLRTTQGSANFTVQVWDGDSWEACSLVKDSTTNLTKPGNLWFEPATWVTTTGPGTVQQWYARLFFHDMAGQVTLSMNSLNTADRVQGQPSVVFVNEDDTTHTEAAEEIMRDLLPPNQNWIVNEDGELTIGTYIQQPVADQAINARNFITGGQSAEEQTYTAVTVIGETRDAFDLATSGAGATVSTTFTQGPGVDPVSVYSDNSTGVSVIADGFYQVEDPETTYNVATVKPTDTGFWGIAETVGLDTQGAVLWTVDLGSIQTGIERVDLHHWVRKPSQAVNSLTYTIEVSTDNSAWTALSANTNPWRYKSGEQFNVDRWTDEESLWQSSFRYIRLKLTSGYWHHGVYYSSFFQELVVSKGFKTEQTIVAGVDQPFTGADYVNLRKRLWKRTKVVGPVPLTTVAQTQDFAIDYLRYTLAQGDPVTASVYQRVSLGETITLPTFYVNEVDWGLGGDYLVTQTTHSANGSVSLVMSDFTVTTP